MHANLTFKIVSWDENPFDEVEDGAKLTQAHVKRSFGGARFRYRRDSWDLRNRTVLIRAC